MQNKLRGCMDNIRLEDKIDEAELIKPYIPSNYTKPDHQPSTKTHCMCCYNHGFDYPPVFHSSNLSVSDESNKIYRED